MAELDLTGAITAAAAALYVAENPATTNADSITEFAAFAKLLPRLAQEYVDAVRPQVEAAAPLIERAVREKAAQELLDWAATLGPLTTRGRHAGMCARRIGPKMTMPEVVEALRRGDFVACHLDDAGRPIPPEERR